MRRFFLLLLTVLSAAFPAGAVLQPTEVAVVYNADSELSRETMEHYCRVRHIPKEQVFALGSVGAGDISRADYDILIHMDLVMQARERGYSWASGPRGGKLLRAIVLMPDLPLRIKEDPMQPSGKIGPTPGNSASLDADLMLIGSRFPIAGPLQNPCYKAKPTSLSDQTKVTAVTRIDGPDKASILRMIDDPAKAEATGLWGWVVVDQGGPYKEGDAWFDAIAKMAQDCHQPLFHETSKQTLADTFPLMQDTIVYFGWYANPANGPFRPESAGGFKFAPGAVAVHLHSYSGTSIKDKHTWVGALLYRGASVTAGNVAEPMLSGCINFERFFSALSEGCSVAEAGLVATPYLSWQNVLMGDPLYRPFPAKPARRPAADNPYAVWRGLCTRYGKDMNALRQQVDRLLSGKNAATYAEMLAWRCADAGDFKNAVAYFNKAGNLHKNTRDITRAVLLQLTCMPKAGQLKEAQDHVRKWKASAAGSVFEPAISRTADALCPPPPKKK